MLHMRYADIRLAIAPFQAEKSAMTQAPIGMVA
jgi:hypothetical protein